MRNKKEIIVNIKREIVKVNPYMKRDLAKVISYIFDCFKSFKEGADSDMEYYDIVGAIFKFNPKFYMDSIYPKMKSLEMTRYIVEKYCLYESEKIIYEFNGKITYSIFYNDVTSNFQVNVIVKDGTIYVTNYRIIAQGKLSTISGSKKFSKKAKKSVINESLTQDLPCYGYQFKRNHLTLKKKGKFIKYQVSDRRFTEDDFRMEKYIEMRQAIKDIKIKLPENQVTELFEILSKDVDHTYEF